MASRRHALALWIAPAPRRRRPFRGGPDELEHRLLLAADVLRYHNDLASDGNNPNETVLTRSNVNAATFGKLFQVQVDGQVYAQPLVVTGVNITTGPSPGIHNVVFVATEHDSLYAIDAAASTGKVLWKRSFLTAGLPGATSIVPVPQADVGGSIGPEVGITGTPVIAKVGNTLYVVAKTKETVGGVAHYVQRIYAVNMSNGTNKTAPFLIGDTTGTNTNRTPVYVYGSGAGSVTDPYNGTGKRVVQFNALRENEREALSLVGGVVYAGWASPGDISPYHGWLIGFDASTLALKGVFNTTPNGGLGGIWQSGGSVSTDGTYLYFQVGNGTFDGNNGATGNVTTAPGPVTGLDANGFPVHGDYGDSFLKVGGDPSTTPTHQNSNGWGLKIVDYFTPVNQHYLNATDLDVGSGGPMLLPSSVGSVAHPDLLLGGGKAGTVYLIDRNKMGKFGTTDKVVQEVKGQFTGVFDTPAYYSGSIYIVGPGGAAKSFSIANATMSTIPRTRSADSFSYPGSTPSISSNGGLNGVVWDIDKATQQLRAYSSDSYARELYTSAQAPNHRDALGAVATFEVPTVADGRVFVGSGASNPNIFLVVYGIIVPPNAPPNAPTNLTAHDIDATRIGLNWINHSVAPNWADGYSIERSTDGTHFTAIARTSAGATAFTVTGLSPSTRYYFRVRAFDSKGYSAYTNIAGATTAGPVTIGNQIAGTFNDATGNSAQSHLIYATNSGVWWLFTLSSNDDPIGGPANVLAYYSSGPDLTTATWKAAPISPGLYRDSGALSAHLADGEALGCAYLNNGGTDVVHCDISIAGDEGGGDGITGHIRAVVTANSITWGSWGEHIEGAALWTIPHGNVIGVSSPGKYIYTGGPILQQEVDANARKLPTPDTGTTTWKNTGWDSIAVIDGTMVNQCNVMAFEALANDRMLAVYDNGQGTEPSLTNLRYTLSNADGTWPGIAVGSQTGGDGNVFSSTATISQNDWCLVPVGATRILCFRKNASGTGVDVASYSTGSNNWSALSPAAPAFGSGQAFKSGAGLFGATDGTNIWLFCINTDAANSILYTKYNGTSWTSWATVPGTGSGTHTRNYISGYPTVSHDQIGLIWTEGQTTFNVMTISLSTGSGASGATVQQLGAPTIAMTTTVPAAGASRVSAGTIGSRSVLSAFDAAAVNSKWISQNTRWGTLPDLEGPPQARKRGSARPSVFSRTDALLRPPNRRPDRVRPGNGHGLTPFKPFGSEME